VVLKTPRGVGLMDLRKFEICTGYLKLINNSKIKTMFETINPLSILFVTNNVITSPMIKKIQKIGNSQGIVLDKALMKLLKVEDDDRVEIVPHNEGLLIKKVDAKFAYEEIGKKHRKSLDKLGQ
jgi:antitoxin component of MazEF toxin-antitoxin module